MPIHSNIAGTLDRADELLRDLLAEYDKCLAGHNVSQRAIQLTHEVCERLRSVLDRTARQYWEQKVSPALPQADRDAATVYFPISDSQQSFDSTMGRWRWKAVRVQHQAIYDHLFALQPFIKAENRWLHVLNEMAVASKHIDLEPQARRDSKRVTVTRGNSSVSWTSGVSFGGGVAIMGAPIDPATQRIVPTPGVTESVELWVGFLIPQHGVNAAGFCSEACQKVRSIIDDVYSKFGL
jgi:hypothetical protein